ncbi:MAG: hypothetical protein QXT79_07600 [Thermofilaceae archaeon]
MREAEPLGNPGASGLATPSCIGSPQTGPPLKAALSRRALVR